MPQQKARNHATVACVLCRGRRRKCIVLSGENKCTNCNERNLRCIFIPGNKRGPKTAADVYLNTFITNPPFIHDEQMSNNDQNITSSHNSFSASNSFTHLYNHTTVTYEVTNNSTYETTEPIETNENFHHPSLCFHDEQIIPTNDQNTSSFSTNDLNGSFYHEIPHPYINPYDEANEAPQNCKC
ncbi:6888_t:CDS:1, partial [Racocetra persica]